MINPTPQQREKKGNNGSLLIRKPRAFNPKSTTDRTFIAVPLKNLHS